MSALEPQWSEFYTERLILRLATLDDADAIAALRTNPAVFSWRVPDTREQAVKWLHDRLADCPNLTYTVRLRSRPKAVIGSVGSVKLPEIGYVYDPSIWGYGYATEALKAWIDMYSKRWLQDHRSPHGLVQSEPYLKACTGLDDGKSPRVLQKCGFTLDRQFSVVEEADSVSLLCWKLAIAP